VKKYHGIPFTQILGTPLGGGIVVWRADLEAAARAGALG